MKTPSAWGRALRPERVEAILVGLLIIELELEAWLDHGIKHSSRLVTAITAVLFVAPITIRNRWPTLALGTAAAVAVIAEPFRGGLLIYPQLPVLVLVVLGYGAGASLELRRSLVAVLLGAGLLVAGEWVMHAADVADYADVSINGSVLITIAVAGPWFVGRVVRERRRRVEAFRDLAAQAEDDRRSRERAAIEQERTQITRELHDIIAHNISAMVAQADGALLQLRRHPEQARDSIIAVEQTGRDALADMRRLLGLLHAGDDPHALAPQPGLDQLPALADKLQAAGLKCQLHEVGDPIDLTPGVNLVGYRVIETALLGAAARHCDTATATIRYQHRLLELVISGDRGLPDLDATFGDVAKRVELYGGDLSIMPAPDGFTVRCWLPIDAAVLTT